MYMATTNSNGQQNSAGARKLPYRIRLLEDSVPLYTEAGTEYVRLGSISDLYNDLEIVEERMGKGEKLWGRLKSNAGWILLEHAEKLEQYLEGVLS